MTREEAIKTLKENYCAMCAYGSQDMDSCDIRSCDNKDAIKVLEQEPCIQEKQANADKIDAVYIDGFKAGYSQARFDLEQESVLDRIKAEIMDTLYVDSLIFGELIDFNNGKISADDVIEEFNRVTRLEVLKIIDKYKTESEEKYE